MELVLGGLIVLVALAIYKYGTQIYGKWLNRNAKPEVTAKPGIVYDPCCECGALLFNDNDAHNDNELGHRVVERPEDELESSLNQNGGGSAFVADFCIEHCPGGCNREHKESE